MYMYIFSVFLWRMSDFFYTNHSQHTGSKIHVINNTNDYTNLYFGILFVIEFFFHVDEMRFYTTNFFFL